MGYNQQLFKIKMIENNDDISSLADVLDISRQSMYKKFNSETAFSVNDVRLIKKHWNLTDKQVASIFLI